jgi:putative endonuclease
MFNIFRRGKVNLSLGEWGEAIARAEYKKRGHQILGSNIFNRTGKRLGEIDFVAKTKTTIIFVEVKTRNKHAGRFGSPSEAVNFFKQRKLLKIVKVFLLKNPKYTRLAPQIDVCAIEVDGVDRSRYCVTIIPNAVEDR